MTEHTLKVAPPYMAALLSGAKTFEVRRNDRAYQAGDTLVLRERDAHYCTVPTCSREQGSEARARVTFVFSGDPTLRDCGGILPGYVVLALHAEEAPA